MRIVSCQLQAYRLVIDGIEMSENFTKNFPTAVSNREQGYCVGLGRISYWPEDAPEFVLFDNGKKAIYIKDVEKLHEPDNQSVD